MPAHLNYFDFVNNPYLFEKGWRIGMPEKGWRITMPTKRRKRLENILAAMKGMAKAQGVPLEEMEPFILGGDPLKEFLAEIEDAWKVMDKLERALYLPDDEDTENALIIEWEHYVEEGNKKLWRNK